MFDSNYFATGWNSMVQHLWLHPDYRLIECLLLQILTLITLVMSISSLFTITGYIRRYSQTLCHWTVRFSLGQLLLSALLGVASFILLIYQQNGRHFDFDDIECKMVAMVLVVFSVIFIPVQVISIMAYRRWGSLVEDAGIANLENVKWYEIQTLDADADIDLRHLVAVKHSETVVEAKESEQKLSSQPDQEETERKAEGKKMEIVLTAHKTRWTLHLLGLIGQMVLFLTVQHKNYYEERDKLIRWGHRFSRVIDEDDYYAAKWELENGMVDKGKMRESFESLDWLEYVARNRL